MFVISDNRLEERDDTDTDVEWELDDANSLVGSHANTVPLASAVQSPRVFYGARFANQAVALKQPEAPWVQNLMNAKTNVSFDEHLGRFNGALLSDEDAVVESTDAKQITLRTGDGRQVVRKLYDLLPFNRKSALSQTSVVAPGQTVTKGQTLARSNFTDNKGTLALGTNARVGLVPYKGFSQDDAVVVSQAFANKLSSEQVEMVEQEYANDVRGGKQHYHALFPQTFTQTQLEALDDEGVVRPGTILRPGDPIVLATKPRVMSSSRLHLGTMGKAMRQTRADAAQTWSGAQEAEVLRVARLRDGTAKVVVRSFAPAQEGDKIVFRAGAKGVISKILSDEHMPRTVDGQPLEVLYNPAGLVSRANDSMVYEMLMGKVAKLRGEPIKVSSYTKKGENWYDIVGKLLKDNNLSDTETVYDPQDDRTLENPITVGDAYVLKLHHMAASKSDARGQGGYTADEQPSKSSEGGSKRVSGLEVAAMISGGAYNNLREMSTLRGQANHEYWQQLRQGINAPEPGRPFVWNKMLALLTGAGMKAREVKPGTLRLGPMTDDDLDAFEPVEIKHGGTVDLRTMMPAQEGLFDPALVSGNKWGYVALPRPVLNPAFEDAARILLGLKKADLREVLAGRREV